MNIGSTHIVDAFAEAFRMRCLRMIVTAADDYWLDAALRECTGYGTSVISCDAEIGVERMLPADETPDGRPGAAVLAFGFSSDALAAPRSGRALGRRNSPQSWHSISACAGPVALTMSHRQGPPAAAEPGHCLALLLAIVSRLDKACHPP